MVNLACMSRQEDRFATLLYYFFRELSEDPDMSSNLSQGSRKKVQRYLDWYEKHGHLVYESGTAKRFIPWLRNVFDDLSEPPRSESDFLGFFVLQSNGFPSTSGGYLYPRRDSTIQLRNSGCLTRHLFGKNGSDKKRPGEQLDQILH